MLSSPIVTDGDYCCIVAWTGGHRMDNIPKASRVLGLFGLLALLGWMYLPRATWFLNVRDQLNGSESNASQLHALCNSTEGSLGQSVSSNIAHNCATVNDVYVLFTLAFWGGLLLLAIAAFIAYKQRVATTQGAPHTATEQETPPQRRS
jgi:hypothetical protein